MRQPLNRLLTMIVSPLSCGLPACREAVVEQDRPRTVLLQLLVDFPDEAPALLLVPLHRLLIEQLVDFRIAVAGVIAVRAAGVILIELRVGVVDPERRSD